MKYKKKLWKNIEFNSFFLKKKWFCGGGCGGVGGGGGGGGGGIWQHSESSPQTQNPR